MPDSGYSHPVRSPSSGGRYSPDVPRMFLQHLFTHNITSTGPRTRARQALWSYPNCIKPGNVDLTNKDRSESGICESHLTCTVPTGNQKASAALGFRVTFFKMPVIGRAG